MGRKGKWFGVVKKVFSPESKEKKGQSSEKSKKFGFGKSKTPAATSESLENVEPEPAAAPPPPPLIHPEEEKLAVAENEQSEQAYSVRDATAAAAEAAAAAAQAAADAARFTVPPKFAGKSGEEIAAIKIQTAFRGYLARRALRALRGLVRLKSLIHGNSVKRQATTTLRCMQTLARVQSQIRSRRIRMSEENQALQRQLLLKQERELENLRMGDEWDDSLQSKEQIVASLTSKQEAAIRRERALAYAFSHQWKNNSRSANPMFMDPNNPHWGWSWLERWMAARPWESRSTIDREINSDRASVKSAANSIAGAEITKAYTRRDTNLDRSSPTTQKLTLPLSRQSPSTPKSKPISLAGKIKSASPRSGWPPLEDDNKSMISIQSERTRRHSIAGSSVGDDESLASSPAVPSYMAPTESMRAKSRFQSQLNNSTEALEKVSVASAKKRLSFPASPAGARRHSGPPKVDVRSLKDMGNHSEENISNGGSH